MSQVIPFPSHPKLGILTLKDLDRIPQLDRLSSDERLAMRAVATVLPFRVNRYVIDELIDWSRVPEDPICQLTCPQPGMLAAADLARVRELMVRDADKQVPDSTVRALQRSLNPHPAGQMELNVPRLHGRPPSGMQHKYRETVLFFPGAGQTCHTYFTYCFRRAQFVGIDELKFASRQAGDLADYLREHQEVNGVLFTGGDPLVVRTQVLRRYLEPLLAPDLDHIDSIRIGTKAPAYWPHRFVSDPDADDLLALFEQVRRAGGISRSWRTSRTRASSNPPSRSRRSGG